MRMTKRMTNSFITILRKSSPPNFHRKGATPAHKGELGIIPGSMTAPAYLVSGKGITDALYSASHGAGRAMSRQKAKDSMTVSANEKAIDQCGRYPNWRHS